MARIALKVDVDTWRGTREGVPRLVERCSQRDAARHLPVQPRARSHRPGDPPRVSAGLPRARSRARRCVEHYGLRTLLYGTLLPGPDIGRRRGRRDARVARRRLRSAASIAGTTCAGRTACDGATPPGPSARCSAACERFAEVFGEPPRLHGAAGWQMNARACGRSQRCGFDYCSDGRGSAPATCRSGGRRADPVARSCRPRCRRSTS